MTAQQQLKVQKYDEAQKRTDMICKIVEKLEKKWVESSKALTFFDSFSDLERQKIAKHFACDQAYAIVEEFYHE